MDEEKSANHPGSTSVRVIGAGISIALQHRQRTLVSSECGIGSIVYHTATWHKQAGVLLTLHLWGCEDGGGRGCEE